jgi:hypothetical protein
MAAAILALFLQSDPRSPVPDASVLKETEKLVRDVFKEEYARKGPGDRQALARKMLQQAIETKDDNNARYVLLAEARSIATDMADSPTALRAAEEMGRLYRVDGIALRQSTLAALALASKSNEELKALALALLRLADEAADSNNFDAAEKAAAAAASAGQRSKELVLYSKAQAKVRELGELKSRREQIRKALDILASRPDDPAANLLVGRDLCFSKAKWDEGLPRLAKGGDATLAALAVRDLANPKGAAELAELGDGWWGYAEKEPGAARTQILRRAASWYERALADTAGLAKMRLEKRIQEVRGLTTVDLLKLIDPAQDAILGPWTLDANGLRCTAAGGTRPQLLVPYLPPEEYDLNMVVERKSGAHYIILGMMSGAARFALVLDSWPSQGYIYGLQFVDGKFVKDNETNRKGQFLMVGKPVTVTCAVRRSGVSVTLDGKQIINWNSGYERLSAFSGAPPRGLFFELFESSYEISRLTLTPLGEEGTRTR